MPEHNVVQRPDLLFRLQQFFGLRQAHITPTLEPAIVPVVVVGDLESRQSWGARVQAGLPVFPALCRGNIRQAGVAATYTKGLLRNPSGSNVNIVIVDYNADTELGGVGLDVGPWLGLSTDFAVPQLQSFIVDTRFPKVPAAVSIPTRAILSSESAVGASAFAICRQWRVADPWHEAGTLDDPLFVVEPGTGLAFQTNVAGGAPLNIRLAWYEMPVVNG